MDDQRPHRHPSLISVHIAISVSSARSYNYIDLSISWSWHTNTFLPRQIKTLYLCCLFCVIESTNRSHQYLVPVLPLALVVAVAYCSYWHRGGMLIMMKQDSRHRRTASHSRTMMGITYCLHISLPMISQRTFSLRSIVPTLIIPVLYWMERTTYLTSQIGELINQQPCGHECCTCHCLWTGCMLLADCD